MTITALPVAVPLLVAAVLAATDCFRARWVTDTVSVLTAAGVTAVCAILLARSAHQPIVYWLGAWEPHHGVALGISLSIDALGAGMATLVALLVTATLVFSIRYFDAVSNLFHTLVLVFMGAMVGFCLSGDLFNMFVFFELMSVAAYALTAYKMEERGPLQGAINFAITNSVGAIGILFGIALIYSRTGALNLAQIGETLAGRQPDLLMAIAFTLIIVGFLIKAAAVPLHFWLADAHAVAPTPICVLFSGVMVELGVYAVARIYWAVFSGAFDPQAAAIRPILIWLGVITALVGAAMCFQQRHLKRLLAFSTVSHVGLFLICVGALTHSGIAAAATYILAHAFAKAALFMGVGILLHRFGEPNELRLRGRGRERALLPIGACFAAAAIALAGTPMIGVFLGKSLGETVATDSGFPWVVAVFIIASGVTAGAILRATGTIFGGWGEDEPPPSEQRAEEDEEFETLQPHDRTPLTMVAPTVVLAVAAVVVGALTGLDQAIQHAAVGFTDRVGYADAVLHGHGSFPEAPTESLKWEDFVYGGLSLLIAVGAAAIALFGGRLVAALPARPRHTATRLLEGLADLHSGHVGDYVTWVTAAVGALGALFALALR